MRVAKPGVSTAEADLSVSLSGEALAARAGESVAAALVAAGRYGCRTTRSGAARGVFCGMGVCAECAVTIDGVGGRLACLEKVRPGMSIEPDPPARRFAASAAAAGAAAAGAAGAAGPDEKAPLLEEEVRCEVLVVGAGPAGLAAAVAARRAGAGVVVVDERSGAGGQYFKQPAFAVEEEALDRQYRSGRQLIAAALASGARLVSGVRVWGQDGPGTLLGAAPDRRYVFRAEALVISSGAFERAVPFPGWTLPGVMTTGAAQTLLRSYLVAAGRRVLVSGNGPLNIQVAAELVAAGVEVVAVAELARLYHPGNARFLAQMALTGQRQLLDGSRYLATLRRAGVQVLGGHAVVEVAGDGRAQVATLAPIGPDGRALQRGKRRVEVDAVCLGFGFVPSSELARSLGCVADLDERSGALVVRRDRAGRTSVPGVLVAGDGGRIGGAEVARASGTLAGIAAAEVARRRAGRRTPGRPGSRERLTLAAGRRRAELQLRRDEAFQGALWGLFAAPRLVEQLAEAGTIVCRCEEVTLSELERAAEPWLAAAGPLKRATRAGMGKCQGRYCSPVVTALAARRAGVAAGRLSGFMPQAPFLPVPVGAIAEAAPAPMQTTSPVEGRTFPER